MPVDPVFKVLAAMQDEADRLMAADRLDDLGLPETAKLLRDPDMPPLILCGDMLLGVRLDSPDIPGEYPVHLFNPDGGRPAVHLQAPRRRGRQPALEFGQLRVKVATFYRRWQWYEFYNRNPTRRRVEPCESPDNNFWVLPLTRQDRKDFKAAAEADK